MEGAGAQMLQNTANSTNYYGPKDPDRRVGAWAGATPVWALLARPDLLARCRRSEVAPAHAIVVSSRVNPRRKR
jgi:hypothetical protein